MSYYIAMDRYGNYDLAHHGILGQKWGIRRFQNKDGSLTAAGKKRYQMTIEKKIEKRHAKVVKELKKHHRYPEKSNAEAVRAQLHKEWADSNSGKQVKKAYQDIDEFTEHMRNKYREDEKLGYQYFDVYTYEEAKKEMALKDNYKKAIQDYGKEIYTLAEKNASKILSAQLKDLSIKDTKATQEILEKTLRSRYGDDWWRWIR